MTARSKPARSAAEWVTLSLSVVVVGALIVVALVEESRREERPDTGLQVSFATERVETRGESYYVPYTVRNTGSEAITSAEIWIDVYDGERLVESAEVTLEFLPLHGTQEGMFVTTNDPTTHTLVSRLEAVQFP